MVGLAVGDAIGTTVEFLRRDTFEPLTGMVGGGPFELKPGEWTDDTAMALCLADSLIARQGSIDRRHLLAMFVNWWRYGYNSATGFCFDIGTATRHALAAFEDNGTTINNEHPDRQANGSIMRLAPVVLCATDRKSALHLSREQSLTTHAADVPLKCCEQLAGMLWDIIETGRLPADVKAVAQIPRDEIKSTGHAPATLEAAIWSVVTTDNFREAILAAANLGDDADTVAAVAGQIAGALYGHSNIPEEWREQVAWHQDIMERANSLWNIRLQKQAASHQ